MDYNQYEDNGKAKVKRSNRNVLTFFTIFALLMLSVGGFCIASDTLDPNWESYVAEKEEEESEDEDDDFDFDLDIIPPKNDEDEDEIKLPSGNTYPNFSVDMNNLPENARTPYFNSDTMTFTVAGIAKFQGPTVVEIWAYEDKDDKNPASTGSGIIISEDGFISTNEHVIADSEKVEVHLFDDSTYEAKLIGADFKSDLAVIKIDAKNLTFAKFGNSEQVELGEQVVAIGNPAGLTRSVTVGYVSGLDRLIQADDNALKMQCFQTDAAISPGNSGGALFNLSGQVVGITSSKYVESSYEGLGFAITSDAAVPIINSLIQEGKVLGRKRIGIVFIESEYVDTYLYDLPKGIYITEIDNDCDISNTKLEVNDIITKINGKNAYDYESVLAVIDSSEVDDVLTADVARVDEDGKVVKEFSIEFKLMEA